MASLLVLLADLRRRRLSLRRAFARGLFSALDLLTPPLTALGVIFLFFRLAPEILARGALPLHSVQAVGFLSALPILWITWSEGRRQIQFQRPEGIVFGEWLVLSGMALLVERLLFGFRIGSASRLTSPLLTGLLILAGGALIARVVLPFVRRYEGLRIVDRISQEEQFAQPEYTPATPECPNPELWKMLDSQTTEVEVLDFLKSLVTTVKPKLIVETGTFLGHGTLKLAEGCRANGFGKVITIEFDPVIFAKAKERIDASGLASWIECRNESSLETSIEGTIDLLYSDSHLANREAEIRRLLPQLDSRGVLIVHDASSHFKIVREAALRLEQEGLISTVLLPTPRGVVIAQRHAGRV
ncbi:MAG: class I SAM-dependent methyltransferase [Acidobacteriota bacterium]|nr:class I SAM-dependent methyltransferase [Acidobacteriota bacterium]